MIQILRQKCKIKLFWDALIMYQSIIQKWEYFILFMTHAIIYVAYLLSFSMKIIEKEAIPRF